MTPVPTLAPPPDACQLLTQAEAMALADRELEEAVPSGNERGVPTMCQYVAPPDTPGVAQVTIIVGDGAKKGLEIDRDVLKHEFTQPEGIGEEAWMEGGFIFFRQGSEWVSIQLITLEDDPGVQDRLLDASRIALSRLP